MAWTGWHSQPDESISSVQCPSAGLLAIGLDDGFAPGKYFYSGIFMAGSGIYGYITHALHPRGSHRIIVAWLQTWSPVVRDRNHSARIRGDEAVLQTGLTPGSINESLYSVPQVPRAALPVRKDI